MYVTFSEGPLPSTLCPEAVQWVLEVLKVPMNLTNWVLVGSSSRSRKFRLYLVSSKLRLMNYLKKLLSSQLVL